VRYQPEWLPVAVENWILDRSLEVRRGNPYLSKEEALVVAVHEFAIQHPHVKGVLRRSDGTVIATSTPSGRPEVTFRADGAPQA
jgi:hypothetical protein